jgi:hypothetical protein
MCSRPESQDRDSLANEFFQAACSPDCGPSLLQQVACDDSVKSASAGDNARMASRMTSQVTTTHDIELAGKSIVVLMQALVNVEFVHSSNDAIKYRFANTETTPGLNQRAVVHARRRL